MVMIGGEETQAASRPRQAQIPARFRFRQIMLSRGVRRGLPWLFVTTPGIAISMGVPAFCFPFTALLPF